jgi:hypothetical protein
MKHIHTFESFLNEANKNKVIDIKDIEVGTILNFKDGEVWRVTKIAGPSSNPRGFFAKPHDEKTKKANTSVEIEMKPEFLEKELESLNESTNRWYGKLLSLGRLKVGIKWVDELSYQSKDIKDFVSKHFPGVNPSNLAIVFKREVGNNWDKVKDILGGVLGDSKDSGEFVIVNAETA